MTIAFTVSDLDTEREALRARLRKMTDFELVRYGKAARYMCSKKAQPFGGKPSIDAVSIMHLEEARAEWKRRKVS